MHIPGTNMVGGVEVPSTTPVKNDFGGIYAPKAVNLVGPPATYRYGAGLDFLKRQVSLPVVGGISVGMFILGIAGTYFAVRHMQGKKLFKVPSWADVKETYGIDIDESYCSDCD